MLRIISNIMTGIKYNPKKWLTSWFLCYATLWTLLEPMVSFLTPNLTGTWKFVLFVGVSFIAGIIIVYPKKEIEFKLPNTSTTIGVIYSDMFGLKGCKVITVNEYFDSEIGDPVSPNSLHGYFLQKILGNHVMPFDSAVDNLPANLLIETAQRPKGKNKKYKIGTTVEVDYAQTKYFLFALSKTDNNYKAYSTPAMMLEALDSLWEYIRYRHNGENIVIPLIGSGLSGVGLGSAKLLDLIILSVLRATKKQELSTKITICLLPEVIEDINISEIKYNWR